MLQSFTYKAGETLTKFMTTEIILVTGVGLAIGLVSKALEAGEAESQSEAVPVPVPVKVRDR
jgi:hypothetical protein